MTHEEIIEGNRLIAEFMGLPHHYDTDDNLMFEHCEDSLIYPQDLGYHTSWDWLMPVVEKIETLEDGDAIVTIEMDNCQIVYGLDNAALFDTSDKIGNTYAAVVEFIKWYNQNKLA